MTNALLADILASLAHSAALPERLRRQTEQALRIRRALELETVSDRQVPACAGCHSPNGAGIPAQYPRLSGQHADYVATQLTNYRDGKRTNNLQMSQVAAKLNDREIKALADYVAGLR